MTALAELSINTLRTLAMDGVQRANSGHPGLPMGAAPMAYVLWARHLRYDARDPRWPDRDRFVLSAGHGSMLLYGLLHLFGGQLTLEDLRAFRQWGSRTPGHPERFLTPGVEATTGPLGQGSANAVGMAIAERSLAHRFNRPGHTVVDHRTFALVSDGDLMEGVSAEAASLAGHLRLGKLVYLYDANDVTLDGPTSLSFTGEDVGARYAAYGWQVLRVEQGDTDLDGIDRAITEAVADTSRPSLIVVHTTIGFGSPNKAGTSQAHGSPLGEKEVALSKRQLGWTAVEPFTVPAEVRAHADEIAARWQAARREWDGGLEAYAAEHPDLAREWQRCLAGELPDGWDRDLPRFAAGESVATRTAAGKVENAIAKRVPELIGGDADLAGSTKTTLSGAGSFDGQSGEGRNIHFGVREHAMGAICNGLDYHGGVRPFAATFFCFSDYMRPAVRLAALNGQPVIYVWTHDSIGLGEDGPTHQPVEHLMALRAIPDLYVVRPGDASEATEAWCMAMERRDGPTALVLSRQDLVVFDRAVVGAASGTRRGAYVLRDAAGAGDPDVVLIATGSELEVAMAAQDRLAGEKVRARVVSMPCWEAFSAQPADYRDQVLPPAVRARVSVEAGVTFGWRTWIGDLGEAVGLDRFGASAPAEVLMEKLGITADAVVAAAHRSIGRARR
ncbi:MAG TPA: transketolase [Kofleriaceae bacterium]|nr:transketolase [Kofleriaceae bacterium]